MKNTIRLIAVILTITTVFTLGMVGCGAEKTTATPIDVKNTFTPLMGTQSTWITNNPDRGYRTEIIMTIYDTAKYNPEMLDDWSCINANDPEEDIKKTVRKVVDLYIKDNVKLGIAYINFQDINELDAIPDKYLKVLDMFFEYCRIKKVRILWRHAYGMNSNKYIANPEDKEYLDNVCADEETMIKHIKQLGTYISKHLDVIQKVSSGVIGNGEFVANFQWPPVDFNNIIQAIVEYMCVPNGLQFSIRQPKYKMEFLKDYRRENGEDYPYADIIGFNNDAVFGETAKEGYHSGCWQYNHDPSTCFDSSNCFNLDSDYFDAWAWVTETAAYTSQSGEMYVNGELYKSNRMPLGIDVIVQMAHHRHTTLSNFHTYGERGMYGTPDNNVMLGWQTYQTVTAEQLDAKGIIYDPNWFVDENGQTIKRNPYEFLRDHLGYKLVADSATIKGNVGKGSTVSVDLSFKNYGFAAAWFLESGFAILNDKYEVVSTVKAGDPDSWMSLPADYYTTERTSSVQNDIISYSVKADLTLPSESGKYYIAFYLKNGMDDFASLSNDVPFEGDGYNILHEIDIK